jgi:long-chain acyl-CoA synthetase
LFRSDITDQKLSLSDEEYERLAKEVTHIIHCAANFKLNLSLEEARKSIVIGTKNVARIGLDAYKQGHFSRFNYISTAEIAGGLRGPFKEEFFDPHNGTFLNTYEQAKAEAEDYLHQEFATNGFPITIYRPGMIVGDSKTGKILNPQAVYQMTMDLFLKPKSKIMPTPGSMRIEAVPVDFLSRAIAAMYNADETVGQVYHLTPERDGGMTLREFIHALQETYVKLTGKRIKPPLFIIPARLYQVALYIVSPFLGGSAKQEIENQKVFAKFFFMDVWYDNTKARTFLAARGIEVPKLRDYLYTICEYFNKERPELAALN